MPLLQTPLFPTGNADKIAEPKITEGLSQLKSLSLDDLIDKLARSSVQFVINVAIAIVVFYLGRFLIRKIYKIVATIFLRRQIDQSLSTFVLSLLNMVLYFILTVTIIGILGLETSSFLALFASAGVAIGMALSGTLQNFAGGVLILILKPYKIGDYIEAQGYAGTVREIQIFFTIITTPDNKSISIPNGGLSSSSVKNWTREEYRRVQWTVSISYGDNVDAARAAILKMFEADDRVFNGMLDTPQLQVIDNRTPAAEEQTAAPNDTPAPALAESIKKYAKRKWWKPFAKRKLIDDSAVNIKFDGLHASIPTASIDFTPKVYIGELASSSVDLSIRAWTRTENYWAVFYYYNEKFYNDLPKAGINFPFPQLDVHLPQPAKS